MYINIWKRRLNRVSPPDTHLHLHTMVADRTPLQVGQVPRRGRLRHRGAGLGHRHQGEGRHQEDLPLRAPDLLPGAASQAQWPNSIQYLGSQRVIHLATQSSAGKTFMNS